MTLDNVQDVMHLSPTQAGMLFHSAAAPESGVYVAQIRCRLAGRLNVQALRDAWDGVVGRHPALRAAFVWDGVDEPLQVIHREVETEWNELDWRDRARSAREDELRERLEEDRRAGFELTVAPLMRMLLIRLDDETHELVWTCHHILADGWSAAVVLREMLDRYRAIQEGAPLDLPPSPAFQEYVSWLQARPVGASEEFWRSYLAGFVTRTSVPADAERRGPREGSLHRSMRAWLSEAESAALTKSAQQTRMTLNTLAQGAWSVLLHRYGGERDVVSGATVAGRPPGIRGVEDAVGLFINTLPVRAHVDSGQRLRDWLTELQESLLASREHEDTPLVRIQEWSDVAPGEPLFDNLLVLENTPDASMEFEVPGLRVLDFQVMGPSNYPLAMVITPGRRIELMLVHDPSVYSDESAARILEHFRNLLTAMPAGMDRPVGCLSMLSEAESRRVLVEFNDSGSVTPDVDTDVDTVLDLIFRHAETSPDGLAVVCGDEKLSYGELVRFAERWARRLAAHGIEPGDPVGICMRRGTTLIAGMLAIMRAGGAYVPLDPEYPQERLDRMVADSGARLVLTTIALASRFTSGVRTLQVDTPGMDVSGTNAPEVGAPAMSTPDQNGWPGLPAVTEDLLAYVIYTSGSTGEPKGVPVSHLNLLHSTLARTTYYKEPPRAFLLLSSAAFDSSVAGIFWTLTSGGTLVVSEPRIEQDMVSLGRCLADHGVTHTLCLPSLYRLLLEHGDVADLDPLKTVITAGEPMPPHLVALHREILPDARLFNEYGPTEATVWCSVYDTADHAGEDIVPIGRPIPGTSMYLLDEEGRPLPVGVAGEIHIAGEGLTAGYLNRPDATAERFIESVIDRQPVRLYRTGDEGRYRADGNIEFLGRRDRQLKIRGFRVEPGDIEAALERHESIREAVVVPVGARPGAVTLAAFFTAGDASPGSVPSTATLRAHLEGLVPAHMVPSRFRTLDGIPRLPNGKVDVAGLSGLPWAGLESETTLVKPRDDVERKLAAIWREFLDIEEFGVYDSFFELGGDSILSIQVTSRANQLGLGLSPNDIFNFPTVAALATRCRGAVRTGTEAPGAGRVHNPQADTASPASPTAHGRPPLVMVHVDIDLANRLRRHLGPDQPLFCFGAHWHRPDLDEDATVEQLAEECLEELRTLQPSGPYFVGGYSMGAPIALEMAQMLARQGEAVAMLFLLDPPPVPKGVPGGGRSVGNAVDEGDATAPGPHRTLTDKLAAQVRAMSGRSTAERLTYLGDEMVVQFRARVLEPLKLLLGLGMRRVGLGVPMALRRPYVLRVYTRAWSRYSFHPYFGDALLFGGRGDVAVEARDDWRDLIQGHLEVETFEGGHLEFSMDPDVVGRWARRLTTELSTRQRELADDESPDRVKTPR